jgi:hypothetical protein
MNELSIFIFLNKVINVINFSSSIGLHKDTIGNCDNNHICEIEPELREVAGHFVVGVDYQKFGNLEQYSHRS